jgi:hypothetical protein
MAYPVRKERRPSFWVKFRSKSPIESVIVGLSNLFQSMGHALKAKNLEDLIIHLSSQLRLLIQAEGNDVSAREDLLITDTRSGRTSLGMLFVNFYVYTTQ